MRTYSLLMLPPFAPPPRIVPLSLRVLNHFNGMAQFGWIFFGFGMVFFWLFAGNADFSFLTFRGSHAQTTGRVTHVESTNASEGDVEVMKHWYEFSVAGRPVRGISYQTGSTIEAGDEVVVDYDESDPARSRIHGMRRAIFSPWAAVVVLFPAVGLAILIAATRWGIRRDRLLREGILTSGRLVGSRPTNMTVNRRRVMELTFEFTSRDGQRRTATARTNDPSRLEDDAQEPLLYDPADPSQACLLDEAPSRPQVVHGELQGRPIPALLALLIPGASLFGHGWVLWSKLT